MADDEAMDAEENLFPVDHDVADDAFSELGEFMEPALDIPERIAEESILQPLPGPILPPAPRARRRVMPRNPVVYGTIVPAPGDVVEGIGERANRQNQFFMHQVRVFRSDYEAARTGHRRGDRLREIGMMVVTAVRDNGGRFLRWENGPAEDSIRWIEMNDQQATDKAMASLRDEIRRYRTPRAVVLPPEFRSTH
jgi:hypothetical protein